MKTNQDISDMAGEYMQKSFIKGFEVAIECIQTDVKSGTFTTDQDKAILKIINNLRIVLDWHKEK